MKKIIFTLSMVICMNASIIYAQTVKEKSYQYKMTSGYGYFNDSGMLNGNAMYNEIGVKLKNGYTISIQGYLAEALNNKRVAEDFALEFLYTYKIANLLIGYDLKSKSGKHSIEPMIGPFLSKNSIVVPRIENDKFEIKNDSYIDIGFAVALKYHFNISDHFSLGLQGTANIAYNYGYLYGVVLPVLSIRY